MAAVLIPIRTCKKHKNEELVVYCKDCFLFICVQCTHDDHLNHSCEGVSKYARDVRTQIPETCKRIHDNSVVPMETNLRAIRYVMEINDEAYKQEKQQLGAQKEQFIQIVNNIFDKSKGQLEKRRVDINSELKDHAHKLEQDIGTLREKLQIHESSLAVYSNHDVIEMDNEIRDKAARYTPIDLDPRPFVPATMVNASSSETDIEDLTAKFEKLVFTRKEGMFKLLLTLCISIILSSSCMY